MLHTILLIRIEPAMYLSTFIVASRVVGNRGRLAEGVSIITSSLSSFNSSSFALDFTT
ncbi:hypothetical protein MUK42_36643 [Musa troglodytarum]|uniref:Uncharacterized protein n=1 Tax=Musa troglodytarum TaxID=320322 RepID=A0A9E7JXF9_9LILI|nr:hypothetical protein MUK42_36643 [Musa troglodytarum]